MPGTGHINRPDALTDRELHQLTLMAEGRTDRQIAIALHLSLKTIKNYNSVIYTFLGVRDRTQAVLMAFHRKLIFPNCQNP